MRNQPDQNRNTRSVLNRDSLTNTIEFRVPSKRRIGLNEETATIATQVEITDFSNERHYSVAELGKLWNLSEKTIRRMFENEPGVLRWGKSEARVRRGYITLRIPESVASHVHRRLRIGA
jgi:hypothetical protein